MTAKRTIRTSLLLAGVFFALIPVLAMAEDVYQAAPGEVTPWTPEDILSAEYASQWKISPDGKWAVWVKMRVDKEKNGRLSNLFLTNLETKKEVRLTQGSENHSRPEWSPNGERISFTSTRALPKPNSDISRPQENPALFEPEISTPKIENMIDVGGRRLHCCVYGNGSPAVVLVSGLDAPQAYWNSVIPGLAAKTTVVTYDRAGIGKSEMGDLPTHGVQSAKDLQVLLAKLGVPRPYILVGHSYGGNVVRLFASLYPDNMGGLILEDTQHEDVLNEMRKILKGKDLEAFDQLMADRFSAPENPKTEPDYRNITREQLRKSKPLPRIPFVVLTSADRAKAMPPLFSDEAIEKMSKLDGDLNNKLAALIPGGRLIIVEGTGHDIHVDKPEALIAPVVKMIKEVRKKTGREPSKIK